MLKLTKISICVSLASLVLWGCGSNSAGGDNHNVGDAPRTENASAKADWTEIKTSGIAISFPKDWKAVDLSLSGSSDAIKKVFGSDPKSQAMEAQTEQMAKAGAFKLFVFAPDQGNSLRSNCNVLENELPSEMKLEDVLKLNTDQLKGMADGPVNSTMVDVPAGKVAKITTKLKSQQPGGINSTLFLAVKGKSMVVITFTACDKEQDTISKVADESIKTFKFE